jgi:hypothetical protein
MFHVCTIPWLSVSKLGLVILRFILFILFIVFSAYDTKSYEKNTNGSHVNYINTYFPLLIVCKLILNWRILIAIVSTLALFIIFIVSSCCCEDKLNLYGSRQRISILKSKLKHLIVSLFWRNLEWKWCFRIRLVVYIIDLVVCLVWMSVIITLGAISINGLQKEEAPIPVAPFTIYFLNLVLIVAKICITIFRIVNSRKVNSRLNAILRPDELFTPKAKRFLLDSELEDTICLDGFNCENFDIVHRVLNHLYDRFDKKILENSSSDDTGEKIMIAYHQTSIKNMISIVRSELIPSGQGMLGQGIYFANNYFATETKANQRGAVLCAKIRLGKIKFIDSIDNTITKASLKNEGDFESVYWTHPRESPDLDELTISSYDQIVEYTVLVKKVHLNIYEEELRDESEKKKKNKSDFSVV